MMEPQYRKIKDTATKLYFHNIWMMAHRYHYGWSQLVCGQPGSGKTKTAATFGWLLDPEFTADDVSFDAHGYISSLEDVKIGSARVWSEMGIGLPARGWYQLSNILTGQIVQTMRIKRPIIFMDVSDLSFIDVQARKLIFHYSEVRRHKNNPPKIWVYDIKINRRTGDIYFPHPLLKVNGVVVSLKRIKIGDVLPDEIWEGIDKKQREFKARLERKASSILRMMDKKTQSSDIDIFNVIDSVKTDKERYTNRKNKLDWKLVQLYHNVSKDKAQQIISAVESEK